MGIISSIKSDWKSRNTAGKINLILDIICGFGAGAVSSKVMNDIAPGLNKVERVCASIMMCGLGMAAGEVATKAYSPYTEKIGDVVDTIKEKRNKEETEHEYTRY